MAAKILILGNYCQTITVIRSLSHAGYHVIIGREGNRVFTQYSRYTSETWLHPNIKTSNEEFARALANLLANRKDIAYIFPLGENEITYLMHHTGIVPPSVKLVMANPPAISTCLNKFLMYEISAVLGIPLVNFRKANSQRELLTAAEEIGYPCVIKPNDSLMPFFCKKAVIVSSKKDLGRTIPTLPQGKALLVQQLFLGHRHNCHFIADKGRLLSYFEQRVLRTDQADGTGYGVDGFSIEPSLKLKAYCKSLIEAVNYSGAGSAQFLVNEKDGSENFLEINPRLDATCALPYYCGYDFPYMAVKYTDYLYGDLAAPPEKFSAYPIGKYTICTSRDIAGWLVAIKNRSLYLHESIIWLKKTVSSFFKSDYHMTWSWKDPLPTCCLFIDIVTSILFFLKRKIRSLGIFG